MAENAYLTRMGMYARILPSFAEKGKVCCWEEYVS